jgi:hypothetical protein
MNDRLESYGYLIAILILCAAASLFLLAQGDNSLASSASESARSESFPDEVNIWTPAESLGVDPSWLDTSGVRLVGRWGGGPSRTVAASERGQPLYFNVGHRLEIVDFSDPDHPSKKGVAGFPLPPTDLDVAGGYAYAALNHGSIAGATQGKYGLEITRSLGAPETIPPAPYVTDGYASAVDVADGYVYLADGKGGLQILDASVPSAKVRRAVSTFSLGDGAVDVAVAGERAYVACSADGLQILDVTDPANPERVGAFEPEGEVVSVVVEGNYAYVTIRTYSGAEIDDNLRIVDVVSPQAPQEVGHFPEGGVWDVTAGHAYLPIGGRGGNGLQILDVSDPSAPMRVGTFNPRFLGQRLAVSDGVVLGNYAYLANDRYPAGLYVVELDKRTPRELPEASTQSTPRK